MGSAQHAEARAYLLQQLGSLGWRTEVQESVGMFDFGGDGTQSMAAVANVIATKPGSDSTGAVLLSAHYDTVAGSPGAADDGIGVGAAGDRAGAQHRRRRSERRRDPADRRRGGKRLAWGGGVRS